MVFKIHKKDALKVLPKAIIFVTDNTLYPYKPSHVAAQKALASKATKLLGISEELLKKNFLTNLSNEELLQLNHD